MSHHIHPNNVRHTATGPIFSVGVAATAKETGRSATSLYRDIQANLFPPPLRLGRKRSAWLMSEIVAVNAARVRGASEDELKQLVQRLTAARVSYGTEVVA